MRLRTPRQCGFFVVDEDRAGIGMTVGFAALRSAGPASSTSEDGEILSLSRA
jgi:hypothetical protein